MCIRDRYAARERYRPDESIGIGLEFRWFVGFKFDQFKTAALLKCLSSDVPNRRSDDDAFEVLAAPKAVVGNILIDVNRMSNVAVGPTRCGATRARRSVERGYQVSVARV